MCAGIPCFGNDFTGGDKTSGLTGNDPIGIGDVNQQTTTGFERFCKSLDQVDVSLIGKVTESSWPN